jgi:23S rRNA pseudouridine1911/1915/1917 synthase
LDLTVSTEAAGARADVFVAGQLGMSRTQVQRLFEDGRVIWRGRPLKAGAKLEGGQALQVDVPPPAPARLEPVTMPIDVLFEDEHLIILNKRRGLVVHPGSGTHEPTLVHGLLARYQGRLSGIGGVERPGIVHRLDKDTSGLMIVARTDAAHQGLTAAFSAGEVQKTYLALVEGHLSAAAMRIDRPIGRHPRERYKMAVVVGGRRAITRIEQIEERATTTWLRALPRTGRTHQIRVHLASIGHPLIGDAVYGHPSPLLKGHFLHASRLAFQHPVTDEPIEFEAPLPAELVGVLDQFS